MGIQGYFLAEAPGSTEMYVIPDYLRNEYLLWCECEFFDQHWKLWADFFKQNQVIYKHDTTALPTL